MEVFDLFKSDWGNLQLAAPALGDRTNTALLSQLEQQIKQMTENPLPDMRPYLDALPSHYIEVLVVKLIVAMGINAASISLVRRYEDDGGVLISGRWNTTASTSADVLIRIAYQENAVRLAGVAEMLDGRDTVEHLVIILPRTWPKADAQRKPSSSKELVYFVDGAQLLALLMRYGIGCHKKVVEVYAFNQGLWLDDVSAANATYSELLASPKSTQKPPESALYDLDLDVPDDPLAAELYRDLRGATDSNLRAAAESCLEWPDLELCIDLIMPWPEAYLANFNYSDQDIVPPEDDEDFKDWDIPEWPEYDTPDPAGYSDHPSEYLDLEDSYLELEEDWYGGYDACGIRDEGPWSEFAFWKKDEFAIDTDDSDEKWQWQLSRSVKPAKSARRVEPGGIITIPRGQLRRTPVRAADMDSDWYDEDEFEDLDVLFGGESSMRMSESDWSDSFDDFDSQDWADYEGTAEYDDEYDYDGYGDDDL